MRRERVSELEAVVLSAAKKIQNGTMMLSEGYRELLPVIHEFARDALETGGGGSVDDLMVHAGPDRLQMDIVGLLQYYGLGEVLVASRGRKDHTPVPDVAGRWEAVVNAGHLTATRGGGKVKPDPLTAYTHYGAKVIERKWGEV